MDTYSRRAALCVPVLLRLCNAFVHPSVSQAIKALKQWDYRIDVDSVPATLFNVFFQRWCKTVARERLPADQAALVAGNAGGIASRLLLEDLNGWFGKTPRDHAIGLTFQAMLDDLTQRLGPDMTHWTWGNLHRLQQKHFLSGRGDLGGLLDLSGLPACGDGVTVCAGTIDANYQAWLGAGYRMVADLSDTRCGIWSVEVAGASGQPHSPHYADQIEPWNAGQLFYLPLLGELAGDVLTLSDKAPR
jgi:penicillin amidase